MVFAFFSRNLFLPCFMPRFVSWSLPFHTALLPLPPYLPPHSGDLYIFSILPGGAFRLRKQPVHILYTQSLFRQLLIDGVVKLLHPLLH